MQDLRPWKGGERMLRSFVGHAEGQGLVEYALILVLIAVVVMSVLSLLGTQVQTIFQRVIDGIGAG